MIRSIAHFLLILVVLACPVQCVIGGDACCGSESAKVATASGESCPLTAPCCHHLASERQGSNSTDKAPGHIPSSDDDCHCDCLCKGAIAAVSQVAEDCGTTPLNAVSIRATAWFDISHHLAMPQTHPPDALSGREIRTLRMSFQV